MDLEKAIDAVHHHTLLRKLEKLGFDSIAIKWFTSYLQGWSQYTKLQNMQSGQVPVVNGVPQRSVLGPCYSVFT